MENTIIKTSCGKEIFVSPEDFEMASSHRWHITSGGYVRSSKRINGKITFIFLHRTLCNAKPRQIVDHVNRLKMDNRRENLRIVTARESVINRSANKNKLSKFKGVAKHKSGWQVYVDGKYIGLFQNEIEAAHAYDNTAIVLHKEFAVTNKHLGLL